MEHGEIVALVMPSHDEKCVSSNPPRMNIKSSTSLSCFFRKTTVLLMSTGRSVGQNSPIQGAVGGTKVVVPDGRVVVDRVVACVVPDEPLELVVPVGPTSVVSTVGHQSPVQGTVGGTYGVVPVVPAAVVERTTGGRVGMGPSLHPLHQAKIGSLGSFSVISASPPSRTSMQVLPLSMMLQCFPTGNPDTLRNANRIEIIFR